MKSILLVEDDQVDAMAIKRVMKSIGMRNELHIAEDGEEGLQFLRNPENEKPCLIISDLNMPRMNGIEFIGQIKVDAELKSIPVIVMTTSKEERDKTATFDLSIAGYMTKPIDYSEFVELMVIIDRYWNASEFPE